MRVTIVGAGNAGTAHAAKMAERGHEVILLKTSTAMHEDNFSAVKAAGGVWCVDDTQGGRVTFQRLRDVTRDFDTALCDSEAIVVLTQTLHHEALARRIAPCVGRAAKLALLVPGNLGSLYFRRALGSSKVLLAEGESTPFDARITEPGTVRILFQNVRNSLAFLPQERASEGLSVAASLLDTYVGIRSNILESTLLNPNLVLHTVGVLLSASRIEAMRGEFWLYKEAFSPSIWNVIADLDEEKNRVIEAASGVRQTYLEGCRYRNARQLGSDPRKAFEEYAGDASPKGPASLHTRYLYEDVSVLLGTLSQFGRIFRVPTPVADSLITLASSLLRHDFWEHRRCLSGYGLAGLSSTDVVTTLHG